MRLRKKVNSLGFGLFLVGFVIIATQCLPDETLQNLGLFFIGLSMIAISLSLAVFSLVIKYGKHRNKKHRKRRAIMLFFTSFLCYPKVKNERNV
jgi:uncharacterized membrane protein YidH (DUF202 family)